MDYKVLMDEIQSYVRQCFKDHSKPKLYYHNLQHTEDVVAAAIRTCNHYQLNDEDFFAVTAAAWLHDTGYLQTRENHEEISRGKAQKLLSGWKVNQPVLQKVEQCILATRMPQQPRNLPEEIMCDADLFHLGLDTFFESNERLRKELNAVHHTETGKGQWCSQSITFLQSHQYHTQYCCLLLNPGKEKNVQQLIRMQTESRDADEAYKSLSAIAKTEGNPAE